MQLEQFGFVQGFVRMCSDGWQRGWHEANGGNASYHLNAADRAACEELLDLEGEWNELATPVPELAGELFMVTGSGKYLRNVELDLAGNVGIIELDDEGAAWRVRWGFAGGAHPTSELAAHLQCHAARMDRDAHVVYHAHAPQAVALSLVLPADTRAWTRILWRCMTESIVVFPQGLAVVPWTCPGSEQLAQKTVAALSICKACVWVQHGVVASGATFDEAYGIVDTVEKAAGLYMAARAACGGAEPEHLVSDEQLREICERYGLQPNEDFLEDDSLI